MKKTLYIIILLVSLVGNAQTYTTEDKALTGVFDVAGKSKAELFSAINKWISINYNSGKSVTQLSDGEAGNIIVKGTNEVTYKNLATKALYPNMKSISENASIKFNHLIEINVKENKFRVIYRLIETAVDPALTAYVTPAISKMTFDCINLNGTPDAAISVVNDYMETALKAGLIGKEKRETYKAAMKPMYDDLNANIITDMKTTMLSINKASTTTTNDGW